MNYLKFSKEPLSVNEVTQQVRATSCGAISIFLGTTRNNFDGKTVISLVYEAYESMAIKAMQQICDEIRQQWNAVENIAIYHRLGEVPVTETSIIIAISSPHRKDAITATEWCIDNVKKTVPIWKKEVYAGEGVPAEWKENKESCQVVRKKPKLDKNFMQKVEPYCYVPPHLIQIKASNKELEQRIEKFMERKREEVNVNNIKEFCCGDRDSEFSCARIDAIFQKRKDSKSHLQVNRAALNTYHHRDQTNSNYLTKFIPANGVEERIQNLETQLNLMTAVPKNIYKRLKLLEDRLLLMESLSPEYAQFWDKSNVPVKNKKRTFTLDEIDGLIADLQSRKE